MSFTVDPSQVNDSRDGCPPNSLPADLGSDGIWHSPDGGCAPVRLSDLTVDKAPFYGYYPDQATSIAFLTLFGITFFAHIALWAKSRRLWLVVLVLAGMGESIGWAGRVISADKLDYSDRSYNAFLVQIVCLTITPSLLSAAAYGIFTLLVHHINPAVSRFRPRTLVWIFVGCDIVSLVIQSAGGGIASGAEDAATQDGGTNAMLAGIIFQLVSMTLFTLLTVEYFFGVRRTSQWSLAARAVKLLYLGNFVSSVLIVIRGVYRSAELAQGWRGHLITHEPFTIWLDAFPMLLVLVIYLIIHPVFTLKKHTRPIDATADASAESTGAFTPAEKKA